MASVFPTFAVFLGEGLALSVSVATNTPSMQTRNRLWLQLLHLLAVTAGAIMLVALLFIASTDRNYLLRESYDNIRLTARIAAKEVYLHFEHYLASMQSLAAAFQTYYLRPDSVWQHDYLEAMKQVFARNRDMLALWDSWEFYAIKPGYTLPYGRLSRSVWRDTSEELASDVNTLSLMGDPEPYAKAKAQDVPMLWEPYIDVTSDNENRGLYMTTVSAPILHNDRYVGLVACDISLDWLNHFLDSISPSPDCTNFLLSSDANIAAYRDSTLQQEGLKAIFPDEDVRNNIKESILLGREYSFIHTDSTGMRSYVFITPIAQARLYAPWAMGIIEPLTTVTTQADRGLVTALIVLLIALIVATVCFATILHVKLRALKPIQEACALLASGQPVDTIPLKYHTANELKNIGSSLLTVNELHSELVLQLNSLTEGYPRQPLEVEEDNPLARAIGGVKACMLYAQKENQLKLLDGEMKAWINEGISQCSLTIRNNANDLEGLCDQLTLQITRYIGANQGAFYLLKPQQDPKARPSYKLQTAFAWGRKRYLDDEFPLGVGLVGACAMEQQSLLVTDLPADFPKIPTGVGDTTPKCALLIPLLHENTVVGVLEFTAVAILPAKTKNLLTELAPSIASSIASVKTNSQNHQLLQDALRSQNRLQKLNHTISQRISDLEEHSAKLKAELHESHNENTVLRDAFYSAEYTPRGILTSASESYLTLLKVPKEEIVGTYYCTDLEVPGWTRRQFDEFWYKVINKGPQTLMVTLTMHEANLQLLERYIPFYDNEKMICRVVKFSTLLDQPSAHD